MALGDRISVVSINSATFPFIVFIGRLASTYTRAAATMTKAYAAGSQKSYFNKFNILLLFCAHFQIEAQSMNVNNIICFVQFLVDSRLSTPTIHTYISAIKSRLSSFGFDNSNWSHPRVILMLKACSRTVAIFKQPKHVLTPSTLTALIHRVSFHPQAPLFKALFLLAFHGFFRISNLLPTSQTTFQSHRHLVRGDVSITPPGVTVYLKWSKTMQANRDSRLIPLAAIPGSPLCPLQAILQINQFCPVPDQCPMFSYMNKGKLVIISQTQARRVLKQTLQFLGLDPANYGFHTFRRSGASLAFSLNIPVDHIKAQGTWTSDAVWAYLSTNHYPLALTTTMSTHLTNIQN